MARTGPTQAVPAGVLPDRTSTLSAHPEPEPTRIDRPRVLGMAAVAGVVTADAGAYLDALGMLPRGAVVADLRSGSWRFAQAAHELGEQLGIELLDPVPDSPLDDRTPTQRRLDDETTGDSTARRMITAAARARAAADRLDVALFVALPPSGPLDAADAVFVTALAEACSDRALPLVVLRSTADPAGLPDDLRVTWSVAAGDTARIVGAWDGMPGVVAAELVADLGVDDGVQLRSGARLNGAPTGEALRAARRQLLAAIGPRWPELAAFLQAVLGEQVDPWLLMQQAGAQIAEGGDEGPRRLAAAARAAMPTPSKRALCDLLIASAHVAHGRFAEVSAMPVPPDGLHPPLHAMLAHVHGWARTMTGRAQEALPFFEQSRALLERTPDTDEYLSTLNITALARLRCGDWDGAWELESRIEQQLGTLARPNAQLDYINGMNMARLQRRAADTAAQLHQTVRAFATTRGVRSDSDGIHENITLGRLQHDLGDAVASRAAYLRAAVLLLSCPAPETVTPRIGAALPSRVHAPTGPETLVDRLAATLSEQLDQAEQPGPSEQPGLSERAGTGPGATFRREVPDGVPDGMASRSARAVGVPGCAVLALAADVPAPTTSPALRRLAAAAGTVLGVGTGDLVVVDDEFGTEVPADVAGLARVARRLRLELAGSPVLPTLVVCAGPGVAGIEPAADGTAVIRFRRYLVPLHLSARDAAVVEAVVDAGVAPTVSELAAALGRSEADVAGDVGRLEQARVLLQR